MKLPNPASSQMIASHLIFSSPIALSENMSNEAIAAAMNAIGPNASSERMNVRLRKDWVVAQRLEMALTRLPLPSDGVRRSDPPVQSGPPKTSEMNHGDMM